MTFRQSKNEQISVAKNRVTQSNGVKHIIKQSQSFMLDLAEKCGSYEPFNNTVMPYDCADRLVAHRISTKFHVEDPSVAKSLQSETFLNYINYDAALKRDVVIKPFSTLSKARSLLHTWLGDVTFDIADVDSYEYRVTPGETYISSQGEVSILAKLADKNHWTTTANCLDDTCVFIYNHLSFKRAGRQHIGRVTRRDRRVLYQRFKHKADVGFHIFRQLLIDRVLTIVDGARASSVPKSNSKRRFINVEAMFPVILQRILSSVLLEVSARHGNDLGNEKLLVKDVHGFRNIERSAQSLHGHLIKSNRFSTIDFSNASDSVTSAAVVALFPKSVSDLLFKYRSHIVVIDDVFHYPSKLSSMGNGFTFEVMTLMLFSIAKTFTHDCRVYGDDVIIPNVYARQFVSACEEIDFNVNNDKTFIDNFFRESCGYFYSSYHDEYITSFDFNQIKSLSDVIITCNKLTVILESRQISLGLYNDLLITRDRIAALVHASRKGPIPDSELMQRKFLALYLFDEGYAKKQRRSKELCVLRKHYIEKNGAYFKDCQQSSIGVSLVFCPFFVPSKSKHLFTSVESIGVLLPALYSGKRLKATIKGKGRWVDIPAFVQSDGVVTLIPNLVRRSRCNVWVDQLEGVLNTYSR